MKTLNEYLALPYTVVLRKDEDGDVVGRVEELPGCIAHSATRAEALELLDEVQREWITDALERNHPVPEPIQTDDLPSGKWVQRVPRSMHARLAQRADQEGVSLNHLVTSMLAGALGTVIEGAPPRPEVRTPRKTSSTAAEPRATYGTPGKGASAKRTRPTRKKR
jgi:predicted RNase H-like HicB family nuclease